MEVDDQKPTGVPDGWEVVTPAAAPAPSKGHDFKIFGVNIHVPGEEKPRLDSNIAGWGDKGAGVAPEDALMAGQAVRGVARAVNAGGALGGAREALSQATPIVKYEATKAALTAIGIPSPLASVAAAMVSGYGGKGKGAAAADVAPEGAHLDRSVPVQAGSLTQEQLAQRVRFGTGTPPPAAVKPPIASRVALEVVPEPVPDSSILSPAAVAERRAAAATPAPSNGLPDQRALNEEAIARRRAEYAARTTGAVPAAANAAEGGLRIQTFNNGKSTVYDASNKYVGSFDTAAEAQKFVADQSLVNGLRVQTFNNGKSTVYDANNRYMGSFDSAEDAHRFVAERNAPLPTAAKPTLTAAESKEYLKLRAAGKTDAQAKAVIETSRALNESLGLSTPTVAETKFPKGMRGGAPR